ncbi:hypothetical protein ACEPPZ_06745 [Paracoccus yeei]|uniref:hypothetical protein n=1 Tax=Paracoccus yeei TaxID=147645 RepID=UPI0037D204BA
MIIYQRRGRFSIDLYRQVLMPNYHPVIAVDVDYFTLEPENAVTHLEERLVNFQLAQILHLDAWDGLTVLHSMMYLKGYFNNNRGYTRKAYSMFHGNPDPGIKNFWRCARGDLADAPGECGAWRAAQVAARPDKWLPLQLESRIEHSLTKRKVN